YRFLAEDQVVPGLVRYVDVTLSFPRYSEKQAGFDPGGVKLVEGVVILQLQEMPVVQTRPGQGPVIGSEPKGMDEVQGHPCAGARARDVARVGRDLGFHEDDVKRQGKPPPLWLPC